MDEDARTLFCGNLSEKVTEDVLYELFLQGGPVQKISIPKDRDGKQRMYGFITYKHMRSVGYALHLFDGTTLYNRTLNMQLRNNSESQQAEQSSNPVRNMNHMLELGQQMILGNYPLQTNAILGVNISQDSLSYSRHLDTNSGNEDRIRTNHPYQRNRDRKQERDRDRKQERDRDRKQERDRDRNRERNKDRPREKDRGRSREQNHNDYHRNEKPCYNRDNNYRFHDFRYNNDNRKRWPYH